MDIIGIYGIHLVHLPEVKLFECLGLRRENPEWQTPKASLPSEKAPCCLSHCDFESEQKSANFTANGQIVNLLGFVGHMV